MTQPLRILPKEMQQTAEALRSLSQESSTIRQYLQRQWNRLDADWEWYARVDANGYHRRAMQELARTAQMLEQMGAALTNTTDLIRSTEAECATLFASSDSTGLAGHVLGAKTTTANVVQGQVPLIMTSEVILASASMPDSARPGANLTHQALVAYYKDQTWQTKFDEEARINQEISELEALIPEDVRDRDLGDLDREISDIEGQIAELEAKKKHEEAEAEKLLNRLVPDWPLQKDDDGGLLRSLADDHEDLAAQYESEIKDLQEHKLELESQHEKLDHLQTLYNQRGALNQVVDAGIPSDGPMKNTWLHNQLGGCVHYVSEKRDVSAWPNDAGKPGHPLNAKEWSGQAVAAGYEVGDRPVKGAIMVMNSDELPHSTKGYAYWTDSDGGKQYTNGTAGHVAYVEDVNTIYKDGKTLYEVTISEANTMYREDGSFVRGAHTTPTTRTVTIDPQTLENGVDFIYDHPPATDVQTA